jgi:hypothetical protein
MLQKNDDPRIPKSSNSAITEMGDLVGTPHIVPGVKSGTNAGVLKITLTVYYKQLISEQVPYAPALPFNDQDHKVVSTPFFLI